jgi:8-oxo-dGTP diphosphatase
MTRPPERRPDSGAGWGLHRRQPWSELDDWDRMTVAADVVLLSVLEGELRVLLHKRTFEPYLGKWAIPGGFVLYPESGDQTILRSLRDKAGLDFTGHLERLDWTWEPGRDPRGWVGCVSHLGLAEGAALQAAVAGSPGVELARVVVPWAGEAGGPVTVEVKGRPVRLAFLHQDIVAAAVKRLRGKLRWTDVGLALMPPTFTFKQLQQTYEVVLGEALNRVTFRRMMLETLALIEPTGQLQREVNHRPAELYRRRPSP